MSIKQMCLSHYFSSIMKPKSSSELSTFTAHSMLAISSSRDSRAPSQGTNLDLLYCGQIPYYLSHEGSLSYTKKKPILNHRRVAKPSSIRLRGVPSLESPPDAAWERTQKQGHPRCWVLSQGMQNCHTTVLLKTQAEHLNFSILNLGMYTHGVHL